MRKHSVYSLIVLSLVCAAAHGDAMDQVLFGERDSEREHAVTCGADHFVAGALGVICRRVAPGDRLTFTIACDPERTTYLTVKLWGSDVGAGQLHLFEGERRLGGYLQEWPELDLLQSEPAYPGRFYYSTYLLPEEMVRGKTEIRLGIGGAGQPTPYSMTRKEADQKSLSRGIYRAYTHVEPFFVPTADEEQGAAPEAVEPAAATRAPTPVEHLHQQLDLAVDRLLTWQYFGSDWDRLVADGKAPAGLTGEINTHGVRKAEWTAEQWRDTAAQRMGGNRVNLLVPEVYARAYHAKWSKHHRDAELIDRVVEALDYFRVAQGNNGGFDDIWSHKWVGGPNRRKAGNCLEGFGQAGLGAAFLTVQREIEAGPCLDQPVDEDDNPDTPMIPRREAWANLFEASRDYLTSAIGRGHAPNQDMADQLASYLSNRALRELAPERAWPEEKIRQYVYSACGFEPDLYGGYWISPKGLSLEPNGTLNGGFCGNYGAHVAEPLFRLCELTGDAKVRRRALLAAHTLSKFRYLSLDANHRPCLRLEGVTTWRNNKTPGKIHYGGNPYAAVVLNDSLSLREIQLAAEHGHYHSVKLDEYWAHFVSVTTHWMRNIDLLEQALKLPAAEARLPFEPGQPDFVWTDEQAGAVVVKHGDTRLVMSLNWRHGFTKSGAGSRSLENVRLNNLARVHYTTPTLDRIANVRMETIGGFGGLYVCRYGPYLVAMNTASEEAHDLPLPKDLQGTEVVDLVAGDSVALGAPMAVSAQSTLVLWLPTQTFDGASRRRQILRHCRWLRLSATWRTRVRRHPQDSQ